MVNICTYTSICRERLREEGEGKRLAKERRAEGGGETKGGREGSGREIKGFWRCALFEISRDRCDI